VHRLTVTVHLPLSSHFSGKQERKDEETSAATAAAAAAIFLVEYFCFAKQDSWFYQATQNTWETLQSPTTSN
jgi:hypothetical protein